MFHRFHGKYPAKGYDAKGVHNGPGPWLALIHEANGVDPEFFGAPEYAEEDTEGREEIYPHARVRHERDNETVTVYATDDYGSRVLNEAEGFMKARS